jgi:hypothetical protein
LRSEALQKSVNEKLVEAINNAVESFFVSFFDGQKKKKHRLLMQGFLMIYDKHLAFILWKKL